MVNLVIKVGIAGISEANGHPFSFSAIINGFDEHEFSKSGWPNILKYLKEAPDGQNGIDGAQVTHAWTQDPVSTAALCASSKIQNQCGNLLEMLGEVDALIIARDDWENHFEMAKPFLENNIPVFVDKPLSLNNAEIEYFIPFLISGKLMSCSGFRFAKELNDPNNNLLNIGSLKLISGVVVNDMDKYGIHLLEAVIGLLHVEEASFILSRKHTTHESFSIEFENGLVFNLDCLGSHKKVFHLSFFGSEAEAHIELQDNFFAFKRTLEKFLKMVKENKPPFNPNETIILMRILQASKFLQKGESTEIFFNRLENLEGNLSRG